MAESITAEKYVQIQLFNFWKWRAMMRRRNILYPLSCVACTAFWGCAHYITEETKFADKGSAEVGSAEESTSSNRAYSFYHAIPNTMYTLHTLAFILFITHLGQKILNDAQGRRMVIMNAMSLNGCMLYCIISRFNEYKGLLTDTEKGVIIAFTSLTSIIVSHHSGLSQNFTWPNYLFSTILFLMWFCVYQTEGVPWWLGIAIIFSLFMVFLCITCEDFELRLAYMKFKADEAIEAQGGVSEVGNSVANFRRFIRKDLSYVLRLVDRSHTVLHSSLVGPSFQDHTQSADGGLYGSMKKLIESPIAAQLMHSRLLCQSLMAANMSSKVFREFASLEHDRDKSSVSRGAGIYLSQLCAKVFNLLETTAGTALALYTVVDSPDFFMVANVDIYEMILYLLAADAVHSGGAKFSIGICSIKLVYLQNKWQVTVQSAFALPGGSEAHLTPGPGDNGPHIVEGDDPYQSYYSATARNTPGGINDDDELEPLDNIWMFEGVGKYLSTDPQLRTSHHTPLTRLASKIANAQTDVQINTEPPEVVSGVVFLRRTLPVPGDTPYGITGQSLSQATLEVEGVRQEWILLEQHASDETAMLDLKSKLELLQVPARICKGAVEYKIWNQLHHVVVVSESALESYCEQMHSDLIRLSKVCVVLMSPDKDLIDGDTLQKIEVKYQLKDAHAMIRLASLYEVHQAVIIITQSRPPRAFGKGIGEVEADRSGKSKLPSTPEGKCRVNTD